MKIVFYMNCHSSSLEKYLKYFGFDTTVISTYAHIFKYWKKENEYDEQGIIDMRKNIKDLLNSADVFLYNPIKDKYDYWSSNNLIKYLRDNCIKINIPYTRCNIYNMGNRYYDFADYNGKEHKFLEYLNIPSEILVQFKLKYETPTLDNINYLIDLLDNFLENKKDLVESHIKHELKEFKKFDLKSDISMYDFVEQNYKKHKLFLNSDHPSIYYFRELFKRIITYISKTRPVILDKEIPYFEHNEDPLNTTENYITNYVKIHGELTFDINNIGVHNCIFNYKDILKVVALCKFNKEYQNKFNQTDVKIFIKEINEFLSINNNDN
jgi:hypothetical protein